MRELNTDNLNLQSQEIRQDSEYAIESGGT